MLYNFLHWIFRGESYFLHWKKKNNLKQVAIYLFHANFECDIKVSRARNFHGPNFYSNFFVVVVFVSVRSFALSKPQQQQWQQQKNKSTWNQFEGKKRIKKWTHFVIRYLTVVNMKLEIATTIKFILRICMCMGDVGAR